MTGKVERPERLLSLNNERAQELYDALNNYADYLEAQVSQLTELLQSIHLRLGVQSSGYAREICREIENRGVKDPFTERIDRLEAELKEIGGVVGIPSGMAESSVLDRVRHVHNELAAQRNGGMQEGIKLQSRVEKLEAENAALRKVYKIARQITEYDRVHEHHKAQGALLVLPVIVEEAKKVLGE